jgi:pimeloyl-ACP methyl ester carboxylesterase
MALLIDRVEAEAQSVIAAHPDAPIRIVSHSIGGLIWLEILDRHPAWWSRIESLVLLGSPVRGTRLGRYLDLRGRLIGQDLRTNRRALAERIAEAIPTLAIAGDLLLGRDGVISVASTRFAHCRHIILPRVSHAGLRWRKHVRCLVGAFFDDPARPPTDAGAVIARLSDVPGVSVADTGPVWWARVFLLFQDGLTVRVLDQPLGVRQVFVVDNEGRCLFTASAGRGHVAALDRALHSLKLEVAAQLV